MRGFQKIDIENAVIELCRQFNPISSQSEEASWSEGELWYKMATCVLSSQVGFETATAFSQRLMNDALLPPLFKHEYGTVHQLNLFEALSVPITISSKPRRYRFPKEKSRQLALTAEHFYREQLHFTDILSDDAAPTTIRNNLVSHVTGFGPKQASMFMRDAHASEGLAIIDRHILDFMVLMDITTETDVKTFSAATYCHFEAELQKYANFLGFPLGRLDWAIWITMRTLRKETLH